MKISATIITFNEERNLPRAIESLRCADEIVVMHQGRVVQQGLKAEARDQLLRAPAVELFRSAVRERGTCPRSVCGLFGEKKTNRARVSIRLSFVRDVCTVEIASQRLHGEHRRQRLGSPPRRLRLRIKSPVTHVIEADAWPGS